MGVQKVLQVDTLDWKKTF